MYILCVRYHSDCSRRLSVYLKTGAAREAATRRSWMAVFTYTQRHTAKSLSITTMFLSFNVDVFAIDKPKIEGISWAILNVCVCVRARVCVCVLPC